MFKAMKPLHIKMKGSKKNLMEQIVKKIDKESKKLISAKTSAQRKSIQTKELEILLEMRKQLIKVRTWPISTTMITVFISQSIALVIAIVSWLISSFGLR